MLAALLLAAACGIDGTAVRRSPAGAESVTGMLGRLPAVEGADRYVVVNLHAKARAAAGLSLPGPGDTEAVNAYRRALAAEPDPGLFVAPAQVTGARARTMAEWEAELGFTLLDVDADATAGEVPEQVEVAEGSIDPAAVESAVRAEPVWSDVLEEAEHGGTTYWSWLEDGGVDVARRTAAREVGEARRLAAEDGAVAWTRTTAAMEATLDAWHGERDTLADVDDLAALAAVLDAEGCHSAFLSTDEAAYDAAAVALLPPGGEAPAADPTELALPRYEAVATGVALGAEGTVLVVALHYRDEGAAAAGAEALERVAAEGSSLVGDGVPWSELLDGATVRADGTTAVGVFPTGNGDLWREVPFTRDTLLLWA